CRWEHVISLDVEKRLIAILDTPTVSPYGNPIPGLKDLGVDIEHTPFRQGAAPLADVATDEPRTFTLRRMSENIQADLESLRALDEVGLRPGTEFEAVREQSVVRIAVGEKSLGLGLFAAELLFVDVEA
ncbi:MAG TPA: iron dependent repressor, metal binding and dimerization domain protein, partial [Arachnia sp.]|nr:iron dependent repressor, metal binding and dimerization domain protein [Arachnia sp.]